MKGIWETKKLGEVCAFLNRGVPPSYVEAGGVLVLNQKCVRDHRVLYAPARRHDTSAKPLASERLVRPGDVLVNSTGTGTLGRVAQLRDKPPEPTTVDSHVTIVRPIPGLFFQEFFGYMLRDIEDQLKESGEGCGGQTELNRSVLAERFVVRFPRSLEEQKRIVGLLDEAFAGLVTAKANAEKSLQNANALFESYLQTVFTKRGARWKEKRIGDVCALVNGRAYKKDEMLAFGKYPLLRVGNFFTNKDWYFSDLELEPNKYCERGDLLYAWSASFGPRIWDGGKVIYHYHIWKVLPDPAVVEKGFLLRLLQWDVEQIKQAHGTGATMMHVGKASMEARVVPIAPLHEQRRLTRILDTLAKETERLTILYQRKLVALGDLKKSLLHQAFSGVL